MGYYYHNASAIYKVWALQCALTANQVEHSMNAIADYVGTNISAQRLDANMRIESRRDITYAGGLEAIIKGMIDYENNLTVQIAGCRALANLCHGGGYENKDFFSQSSNRRRLLIARCGGVDTILKALNARYPVDNYGHNKYSRDNTDLQEHACRALCVLSLNPKAKKVIVKKGGEYSIRTVIANVSSNNPRSNVEFWAGLALDNLITPDSGGGHLGVLVAILAFLSGVGIAIYADQSSSSS